MQSGIDILYICRREVRVSRSLRRLPVSGYTTRNRTKRTMKKFYYVFLLFSIFGCSQTSKEKLFVGYEPIMWNKDINGKETNEDFENPNKKWFHKNLLKINKDSVYLDRVPISKIGKKTLHSASDGGFYYYSGIVKTENGQKVIELTEISCDYCPELVSENSREVIQKRKLFGKITNNVIEINNVKFSDIEYTERKLTSEYLNGK